LRALAPLISFIFSGNERKIVMPKRNPVPTKQSNTKRSARDAFLANVNDPLRMNADNYSNQDLMSGMGMPSNHSPSVLPASPTRPNADLNAIMKLMPSSPLGNQNTRKSPVSAPHAESAKPKIVKDRFGFTHVFAPNGKVKVFDRNGVPATIASVQSAMKRQAPPSEAGRNPALEGLKTVPGELVNQGAKFWNGMTDFFGQTIGNSGEYVGNRVSEGVGYLNNDMARVREAQEAQQRNVDALTGIATQATPGTFIDLASGTGSIAGGDSDAGWSKIKTIPARNFQALKEDPQQWALNFVAVASMGAAGVFGKAASLEAESARVAKLGQTALAARYASRAAALRKVGGVMLAKPVTDAVKTGAKFVGGRVVNGARTVVQTTSEQVKKRFPTTGDVIHLTDAEGAAGIDIDQKIGSQWNVYGLTKGKVPGSGFRRTAATQARRGLTHEVPITGKAADLMKPPPFVGPYSLYRRMIGVRQSPLGSIDLKTGTLDPTEIFQNGEFRPITRKDMSKYYLHRFIVDYAPDTAINFGIGALLKSAYDNYQNEKITREAGEAPRLHKK
jgi:hypothetical protein